MPVKSYTRLLSTFKVWQLPDHCVKKLLMIKSVGSVGKSLSPTRSDGKRDSSLVVQNLKSSSNLAVAGCVRN